MVRHFVGDNTNQTWHHDANWHDAPGGSYPGNASVPAGSDDVVFDGSGTGACTLTAAASAASIDMQAGYSGTFDAATYDVAAGDVTLAGSGTWDMGSGTWTCSGNFDHSGVGTFTRGTSTVAMTGTAKTIKWGVDLHHLTIQAGATIAVHAASAAAADVAGDLVLSGQLTVPSGKTIRQVLVIQADLLVGAAGSLTGDGAYYAVKSGLDNSAGGTVDVASLELMIGGSGSQQETLAGTIGSAEVILSTNAGAGTTHTWQLQTATFAGNVTYQAKSLGTLSVDNSVYDPDLTYQGDVTRTPGSGAITYTAGSGSVTLDGMSGQSVDLDFGSAIEAVEVDKSGGTLSLAGDLEAASFAGTAGTMDPAGQTVTTTGDCTWSSGFDFIADGDAMNGCSWIVGGNFSADSQTLNATASWVLDVTGTAVATGVAVAYSNASDGTEINALDGTSTNNGNNQNWAFPNPVAAIAATVNRYVGTGI